MKPATKAAFLLGTGFGSGYSPVAPGTAGSAACMVIVFLLRPWLSPLPEVSLFLVVTLLGIPAATRVARSVGKKDPGLVVVDEFSGYLATIFLLPKTIPWLLAAFFLFRILDIWKPWPCRRLEKLPDGLGIMMDDVVAGIYGNLLLQAARLLIR